MDQRKAITLTIAEIVLDCEEMSRAALAHDFDEARFRASLIASKAREAGLVRVAAAAERAIARPGPHAQFPHSGYGGELLRVASAIDVIWFDQR